MQFIKDNWKKLLLLLILLIGIPIGLILVNREQIFKSKAAGELSNQLDIDNQVEEPQFKTYEGSDQPIYTYKVQGNSIKVKLKDGTIENLNQEEAQQQ